MGELSKSKTVVKIIQIYYLTFLDVRILGWTSLGLKSRCWQVLCPLGQSRGELIP